MAHTAKRPLAGTDPETPQQRQSFVSWEVDEMQRNTRLQLAVDAGKEILGKTRMDWTERPEDGGMHPQLPELVRAAEFSPQPALSVTAREGLGMR